MATIGNASPQVEFSKDELLLLTESLKDEKFRGLLGEYAKGICDPEKQKHYESEVKKWEKQRGVDVVFVHPSPGFSVVVRVGDPQGEDFDPVCVNICSSDAVQKPSFVRASEGTSPGHKWSIPHAVTKPRNEVLSGEKQLLRELQRGRGSCKRNPNKPVLKQVLVHDVVFHPETLHLTTYNHVMKQCVVQTAMDSLANNFKIKVQDNSKAELKSVNYVGKPTKSVIRKVIDNNLYETSETLDFTNKAEDERTNNHQAKSEHSEKQSTKALEENSPLTPHYTIKHVNKVDLQDFALQLIPQRVSSWRPQALKVEIHLPGVSRASQVDADVCQQVINLRTTSTPEYKLELPLPYPVDEESSTAKFDVATQRLTLSLAVMSSSKKEEHSPLASPSSDSGIECEMEFRTNSDGDNSSEVSVSSQDDGSLEDDESSVFESAPSSPVKEVLLVPSYSLRQTKEELKLVLNCGNVLPSSVKVSTGNQSVDLTLTSVGGGQTKLNYGLKLVSSPHELVENGVKHQVNDNNVELTIEKARAGYWETCQIGHAHCLATVNVEKIEKKMPPHSDLKANTQLTKEENDKHVLGAINSEFNHNQNDEGVAEGRPRVTRAVSMCETSTQLPALRLKGPTCSWPRGILKRRSRSLSESQVGSIVPLESLLSFGSSLEMDLPEDKDGEESVEEEALLSSSVGEKKSVRFNEVVSRQLFRSNASILGRRAKNQKKALKKQKLRERRASEGDQRELDSDNSQSYCGSDSSMHSGANTTTTEDESEGGGDRESVTRNLQHEFDEVDLDVENNNSSSNNDNEDNCKDPDNVNNNINNNTEGDDDDFVVKTNKKKKKKNKNKAKKFEPTNNYIFQLDVEP